MSYLTYGPMVLAMALTTMPAAGLERQMVDLPGHDRPRPLGAEVDETRITRVIHVDAERGDDARDGSETKPLQTLKAAIAAWQQQPETATRIVLRAGTYRLHDTLVLPESSEAPLVIECTDTEPAVISGFRVVDPAEFEVVDAQRGIYRLPWEHNWDFWNRPNPANRGLMLRVHLDGQPTQMSLAELEPIGMQRERKGGDQIGFNIVGFRYRGFNNPLTDEGGASLQPGQFGVVAYGPGDEINGIRYEPAMHGAATAQDDRFANSLFFRLPEGVRDIRDARLGLIEVAVVRQAIHLQKSNTVFRNLRIEGFASQSQPANRSAVFIDDGEDDLIHDIGFDRCDFVHNASSPLATSWLGNHMDGGAGYPAELPHRNVRNLSFIDCRFEHNGGPWGVVLYATDSLLLRCSLSYNGWRMKDVGWSDPLGGKVPPAIHTACVDTAFIECRFNDNFGNGFTHDTYGERLLFDRCQFNDNARAGMQFEVGLGPILIRDSEMLRNGQLAIIIANTDDVTIEHSRLIGNGHAFTGKPEHREGWIAAGAQVVIYSGIRHNPGNTWRTIPARSYTERLTVRDSVLACPPDQGAQTGDRAVRIYDASSKGDYYHEQFVPKEFTGERNTYWSPVQRDVFVVQADRGRGEGGDEDEEKTRDRTSTTGDVVVDLEGWQKATGSDKTSRWARPEEIGH